LRFRPRGRVAFSLIAPDSGGDSPDRIAGDADRDRGRDGNAERFDDGGEEGNGVSERDRVRFRTGRPQERTAAKGP